MSARIRSAATCLGFALLVMLVGGCAHVYQAPATLVTSYPVTQDKIRLRVRLVLTRELRATRWERKSMGDTWSVPMGENLCRNSENLCRQLFQEVAVESTAVMGVTNVDAVLTPRVVAVEQSAGAMAWGEAKSVLMLEWSMTDREGKPAWVETVKGEAKTATGNAFTYKGNTEKRVGMMLEQVFLKSHEAMTASPELRRLAERR